jgi:type II secretory pathway pseudopilin PulG
VKGSKLDNAAGFTILEMIVVLLLSSLILTAAMASFTSLTRTGNDQEQRVTAQLQAQSVLDMMTPEIRMIGNGVPFHQANFLIGQTTLADNTVTEPILVSGTTSDQIQFRLNETGETYVVTADFDPSVTNTVTLTSVNKLYVGDQVYITNSTVGEDDGFWGTIQSIDEGTNSVTFAAGTQYSTSSVFDMGSLFEVVPVVTYTSTPSYGGITRDNGTGALTLVTTGSFTLTFLNNSGSNITLPLVAAVTDPFPASAIQNVRAVKISVSVRSPQRLSTGNYYVATVEQTVGIRNLNYNY